jgi:hypothetical protein
MSANKDDLIMALDRIEQRLKSLERWLRFANMDKLRSILEIELNEDRKKLVYEYSDGSRGYRDVGELSGVPAPTIQTWWIRWFSMGIMEASPSRSGRVQRICSLKDVGIDLPATIRRKSQREMKSQRVVNDPSNNTLKEESENGNRESR